MMKYSILILTLLTIISSLQAHKSILAKKHIRRTLFAATKEEEEPSVTSTTQKDPESVEIKQLLGKTLVTDCGAYREPILDLIEARYTKSDDPEHFKKAIDDFIAAVTVPLTDDQERAIDAAQSDSTRKIIKLVQSVADERCHGKTGDALEECSDPEEDKLRDDVVNKIREIEDSEPCKPALQDTQGELDMVKCTKEKFGPICDAQAEKVEAKESRACKYTNVKTMERECEDGDSKKAYNYLCDDVDAILDNQIEKLKDLREEEKEADKEVEDIENEDKKNTQEDIKERCEEIHAGDAAQIQKCINEETDKAEDQDEKAKEACEGKPKTYLDDYAYSRCLYKEKHKACIEDCTEHEEKKLAFYYCKEVCEERLEKRKLKVDKLKEMQENQEEFEKKLEEARENNTCEVGENEGGQADDSIVEGPTKKAEAPENNETPTKWTFNIGTYKNEQRDTMMRAKKALEFGFEGLTGDEQAVIEKFKKQVETFTENTLNYPDQAVKFFLDREQEKTSYDFQKLHDSYEKSNAKWDSPPELDDFLEAFKIAAKKSKNPTYWKQTLTDGKCQQVPQHQPMMAYLYLKYRNYQRNVFTNFAARSSLVNFLNNGSADIDKEPYWEMYKKFLVLTVVSKEKEEIMNAWRGHFNWFDTIKQNGGKLNGLTYPQQRANFIKHLAEFSNQNRPDAKISEKINRLIQCNYLQGSNKSKCEQIARESLSEVRTQTQVFRARWTKFDENFEI